MAFAQRLNWEDFSRGFHGGYFDSQEVEIFNYSDEKQFACFSVREYTSDEEDFFGVQVPKWELYVWLRDVQMIDGKKEYETEFKYRIGTDSGRAEYMQEFAEYALELIRKHGNISRLPFSERVED